MNCLDFLNYWNDRLDGRERLDDERLADASLHEKACDDCHRLASGYRALMTLLPLTPSRELPSENCVDRVLEALANTRDPRWNLSPRRLRLPLAIAASLLLGLTVGLLVRIPRSNSLEKPVIQTRGLAESGSLSLALAEASKATLAFARETSAPATRVGNDVLGLSDATDTPRLSFSMPLVMTDKVDSSSEALRSLGRRVNNGVRPLSGTARAAFGFLLGSGRDDPPRL